MATTPARTSLKWDVLVTKRQGLNRDLPPDKEKWMWVPTSATLIYGQRDAVLVDAFLTVEQAHAAVEWIAASGKNLTTIYITQGHGDHFFGIGALHPPPAPELVDQFRRFLDSQVQVSEGA
jgi:glyoxylase-like metal-dependent hydrolase (beta-lactamase superfamily II)